MAAKLSLAENRVTATENTTKHVRKDSERYIDTVRFRLTFIANNLRYTLKKVNILSPDIFSIKPFSSTGKKYSSSLCF